MKVIWSFLLLHHLALVSIRDGGSNDFRDCSLRKIIGTGIAMNIISVETSVCKGKSGTFEAPIQLTEPIAMIELIFYIDIRTTTGIFPDQTLTPS